jgi:hypothetical protein
VPTTPAASLFIGEIGRKADGGSDQAEIRSDRTPDTRIMIPPVFPVFTGDSADFGRQIGLFC